MQIQHHVGDDVSVGLLPKGPWSPREMRKGLKSNSLQTTKRRHAKQSTREDQETVGPEKGM